jgi:hypothetical protein
MYVHTIPNNIKIKIYRTGILAVLLCGCEAWPLTWREEHRPRVFENRVLRKIFQPKREEVTGQWRRLHNEKLCDLYSSPNVIPVMGLRGFGRGDLRKRNHLEDLGLCWTMILKWILKKWDENNVSSLPSFYCS